MAGRKNMYEEPGKHLLKYVPSFILHYLDQFQHPCVRLHTLVVFSMTNIE